MKIRKILIVLIAILFCLLLAQMNRYSDISSQSNYVTTQEVSSESSNESNKLSNVLSTITNSPKTVNYIILGLIICVVALAASVLFEPKK